VSLRCHRGVPPRRVGSVGEVRPRGTHGADARPDAWTDVSQVHAKRGRFVRDHVCLSPGERLIGLRGLHKRWTAALTPLSRKGTDARRPLQLTQGHQTVQACRVNEITVTGRTWNRFPACHVPFAPVRSAWPHLGSPGLAGPEEGPAGG